MDSMPAPEPGADFNVVMIGAGVSSHFIVAPQKPYEKLTGQNIMFGSDEGPWK
jgi:hypothetical protein